MRFKSLKATSSKTPSLKAMATGVILGVALVASAFADPMTTESTTLGELLDNPASKAVLEKHAPMLTQGGQIDQARGIPLKTLQSYMGDALSDDVLKAIDAELAEIE